MFCANCHLIFRESQTYSEVTPGPYCDPDDTIGTRWTAYHNYAVSYQDLLTTAIKCHCCHEILLDSRRHLKEFVPEPERKLNVRMELMFDEHGVSARQGSLDIYVNEISSHVSFETNVPKSHSGRFSHKMPVTGPFPADSTGSAYTAAFVRRCLKQCKSRHARCRVGSIEVHWYPTRLVEVLEDGGARVIETSETTPTGPYATLSHCWGATPMSTATTENIGRLKHHIAMPDLPKTFRDALQFIKAIGISFIWIDSLCIIQDSVEDWKFESRTMLQVYRHAECNIAAADSEDSRGGLFRERNHAILPSGWFPLDGDVPELKGAGCCSAVPYIYFRNAVDDQIGSSRLMHRGWVFQEWAASRRVIAFGRDQVFWDCSALLQSDVLPGHRINEFPLKDSKLDLPNLNEDVMGMAVSKHVFPEVFSRSYKSLEKGLLAWQDIVQRYSACGFTFNMDRAVAILGVAQMMSNALKAQPTAISATYWSGLWLQDMHRQLTWEVSCTGLRRNCRAPSWSWLSIDGPVEWNAVYSRWGPAFALAVVSQSDTQMARSNSTFCELSGELRMWCTLHLVHETAGGRCSDHLDDENIGTGDTYFLPLSCVFDGPAFKMIHGLIVQPVESQPGSYSRCGIRKLWVHYSDEGMELTTNMSLSDKRERVGHILGETSSGLGFEYEVYDPEMGYLVCIL